MKQAIGLVGVALAILLIVVFVPAWGRQRLDTKDTAFVKEACQGGMLEVKLGEQALQNASSEDVKRFAKRMVDDHGKASKELEGLIKNKGVTVSTNLETKNQQVIDKLSKLKGPEFDREYMRQMVADHQQDLADFQKASTNLQDPDIKAWVMKTLPTLNEHLREAKEIQNKVDKK